VAGLSQIAGKRKVIILVQKGKIEGVGGGGSRRMRGLRNGGGCRWGTGGDFEG